MVSPLLSSRLCNPRQVSAGCSLASTWAGGLGWPHCASQEGALYEIYADGNTGVNGAVRRGNCRHLALCQTKRCAQHSYSSRCRGRVQLPTCCCLLHTLGWAGLGWETLNKDPIRIFSLNVASTSSIAIIPILHSTGQASLISYRCLTFSSQNFCRLQLSRD